MHLICQDPASPTMLAPSLKQSRSISEWKHQLQICQPKIGMKIGYVSIFKNILPRESKLIRS